MTTQPEDIRNAVRQIANGATVGMVETALKKKGVGSAPRAEVLRSARRIINRRARGKHLLICILGLLILASGGYWLYACVVNRIHRVQLPTVVLGAGLLLSIYGLYGSFRDAI